MLLDEINLTQLRRAVCLFLEEAYRGEMVPAAPTFDGNDGDPVRGQLGEFLDESTSGPGAARCYALRLGNRRYPFMKLRLQECLYEGEFFFSVDTHDQMFAGKDDPELARLMAFNREVKSKIEAAWEGASLPTTISLKGIQECHPVRQEDQKGQTILLVDDDPAIQDTIARMLETKGYDVDLACDGQDAVDLADPGRHSLILMDVEMPRMTGLEACEELKADPDRACIPILLATAGAIELARAAAPDGFLIKPFHADALFRFLDAMLHESPEPEGTASSR